MDDPNWKTYIVNGKPLARQLQSIDDRDKLKEIVRQINVALIFYDDIVATYYDTNSNIKKRK